MHSSCFRIFSFKLIVSLNFVNTDAHALNLLSHGKYSVYEPVEMGLDNKELFSNILRAFLEKYKFELPELLAENAATSN